MGVARSRGALGHDAEVTDEPEQVRALQAEGTRGVGAIASGLLERLLDQASLEGGHGVVPATGRRIRLGDHGPCTFTARAICSRSTITRSRRVPMLCVSHQTR
jgi:hypothetical protein